MYFISAWERGKDIDKQLSMVLGYRESFNRMGTSCVSLFHEQNKVAGARQRSTLVRKDSWSRCLWARHFTSILLWVDGIVALEKQAARVLPVLL